MRDYINETRKSRGELISGIVFCLQIDGPCKRNFTVCISLFSVEWFKCLNWLQESTCKLVRGSSHRQAQSFLRKRRWGKEVRHHVFSQGERSLLMAIYFVKKIHTISSESNFRFLRICFQNICIFVLNWFCPNMETGLSYTN